MWKSNDHHSFFSRVKKNEKNDHSFSLTWWVKKWINSNNGGFYFYSLYFVESKSHGTALNFRYFFNVFSYCTFPCYIVFENFPSCISILCRQKHPLHQVVSLVYFYPFISFMKRRNFLGLTFMYELWCFLYWRSWSCFWSWFHDVRDPACFTTDELFIVLVTE